MIIHHTIYICYSNLHMEHFAMFVFEQKLQRVGHGVLRLASRKSKRDVTTKHSPATLQVGLALE